MRFSSFRYLIKEGVKNIWLNRLMSLASIGVLSACLLMIGLAYLVSVNISNALGWMERQNVFMAYVEEGADPIEVEQVGRDILSVGNIAECVFISREQAFESVSELLGEYKYLLEEFKEDNDFLPDAYKITVEDLELFDETVYHVQQIDNVSHVRSRRESADLILKIRKLVTNIGMWLFIILFVVALFIIANTVKLTMYVRRLEINIMKSVGATNNFIRLPFIVEGIILGLFSAIFTYGVIWYLYRTLVVSTMEGMVGGLAPYVVKFSDVSHNLLAGFVIAGVVIGCFGGLISIHRYLKDEGGVYNVG